MAKLASVSGDRHPEKRCQTAIKGRTICCKMVIISKSGVYIQKLTVVRWEVPRHGK